MITKKEVENIAKLARLGLSEKETEKIQKELSAILDYFNLLKEASSQSKKNQEKEPAVLENIFREDKEKKSEPEITGKLLEMAPDREKNHLKVKAIL